MTDIAQPLLTLFFALAGISIVLFGSRGLRRLFRVVMAPFGCLARLVVGALMLVATLTLVAHWGMRHQDMQGVGNDSQQPGERDDLLLAQYPLLSQLDSDIYDPEEFADQASKYACLATVYVMIERGRGNALAKITNENFDMERGAINPGYALGDEPFSGRVIEHEVRAGRPVILHGEGGPLKDHYMLAVGLREMSDGRRLAVTHDPWKAKRVEVDLSSTSPAHPTMPSITISKMRRVKFGQ